LSVGVPKASRYFIVTLGKLLVRMDMFEKGMTFYHGHLLVLRHAPSLEETLAYFIDGKNKFCLHRH
jgi:hypothetical protein